MSPFGQEPGSTGTHLGSFSPTSIETVIPDSCRQSRLALASVLTGGGEMATSYGGGFA